MTVASLELCRELYELSGWRGDMTWEHTTRTTKTGLVKPYRFPVYNLGYLLRKLPKVYNYGYLQLRATAKNRTEIEGWQAIYSTLTNEGNRLKAFADTPEDAAAKLAIELFKQNILKKG